MKHIYIYFFSCLQIPQHIFSKAFSSDLFMQQAGYERHLLFTTSFIVIHTENCDLLSFIVAYIRLQFSIMNDIINNIVNDRGHNLSIMNDMVNDQRDTIL